MLVIFPPSRWAWGTFWDAPSFTWKRACSSLLLCKRFIARGGLRLGGGAHFCRLPYFSMYWLISAYFVPSVFARSMTALLLKTLDPSLIVVHVSRHLVLILDRKLLAYVYPKLQQHNHYSHLINLPSYHLSKTCYTRSVNDIAISMKWQPIWHNLASPNP